MEVNMTKDSSSYAYNVSGIAYEHSLPDSDLVERIVVSSLSSKPLSGQTDVVIPSPSASPEELALSDDLQYSAMFVGLLPHNAAEFSPKSLNEKRKEGTPRKRTRGGTIKNASSAFIVPFDGKALRVVVSLKPEASTMIKFYALINQKEGVCTGYNVSRDEVFFLPRFRDDSLTSVEERRSKWTQLIRDHTRKFTNESEPPKPAPSKAYDSKIEVPFYRSRTNEIQLLVATYAISNDPSILEDIQRILESMNEDLAYALPTSNVALNKLIKFDEEFSLEDGKQLIEECEGTWPELIDFRIQPDEVSTLARGLRESQIALEYRLVRPFLVEGCARLRSGDSTADAGELVVGIRKHVRLQLGDARPIETSMDADFFGAFLESHTKHIEAIVAFSRRHEEAMKGVQINQATGDSISEIWEKYASKPDMDSARAFAMLSHRYSISQLIKMSEGVGSKLEDYLTHLLQFQNSLRKKTTPERDVSLADKPTDPPQNPDNNGAKDTQNDTPYETPENTPQ